MKSIGLSYAGAGLILLGMFGCLPYPVGNPEQSKVDLALAGYWMAQDGDARDVAAVFPFDQHTYLVEFLKLTKQDGAWKPDGPPGPCKAWLTEIGSQQFMTLDFLQQHLAANGDKAKVYPLLRVKLTGEIIEARPVNAAYAPLKSAKSAAEEMAVIARDPNNAALYSGEASKFKKLDPNTDKDMINMVSEQ